ncbi:At1g76660 [Fagus crenata]|uniref:Hydroxyproline-rich glycoprotein family protein n=1 Tax=Fagus sylvatica TaxID=28930 RepID=A0A2N9FV99_FAGSY
MRGGNGDSRALNNAWETISAAATVIASAENRAPQATVQKTRWGSFWSLYWCFGSPKHGKRIPRKRIGHAVISSETTAPGANASASENPIQAPAPVLPFVAPPSSPASFLQSEPPSAIQSPAGSLSFSVSANMYSPGGPASIFAIGPYAHETQLVSPPVFSTFTTEPSTAPFTPPPESVHLTTPSSPEVPFAQMFDPNLRNGEAGQRFQLSHYEFHSYQLHPGSPVGQLISPSSGISGSGTSSPFPDHEFAGGCPPFLEFRTGDPPKLLNLETLSTHERGSCQGSGSLTPDAVRPTFRDGFLLKRQISEVVLRAHPDKGRRNNGIAVNHRVSFELSTEDVKCVEKNPLPLAEAVSASLKDAITAAEGKTSTEIMDCNECRVGETSNDAPEKAPADGEEAERHQKHRSITLGSAKEFNFDSRDGGDSCKPNVGSDWWANEKVVGKECVPTKNWFPMMQPGFS